ncbi:MAG TPA: DNA mismatch repair endonuclease MutL [Syntrophales bacterium]|nr:DNA mismatch repair endonuclease MutL [Syntrophales bacterium]
MSKIEVLPQDVAERIAAGEVVERPASIVKELLENALDAGASSISVTIEKGGCESIRVADNGRGIEAADVPLAFARHATSKIRVFDDLFRLRTFGFRGEALASIAAVARVEMVSRTASSPSGMRIVVESGTVRESAEIGCPVGTTVLVDRIFASVPARKKFLKTAATEQGNCLDTVTRLAMSNAGVGIRVTANGRETMNLPASGDLAERLALLLGGELRGQLVPLDYSARGIRISGFAGRPDLSRSSSRGMFSFVNRRSVRDPLLTSAIMTAYRGTMEGRRYPAVVLFVDLPAEELDVNVHPAKVEVRFRDPRAVYETVVEALTGAAANRALSRPGSQEGEAAAGGVAKAPENYRLRIEEALKRYTILPSRRNFPVRRPHDGESGRPAAGPGALPERKEPTAPAPGPAPEPARSAPRFSDLLYLGQILQTYLVFAGPSGLVLLDQHAAHERVLFDKLKKSSSLRGSPAQRLLLPEVMSLPPGDFALLSEAAGILGDLGLEVEPFGADTAVVRSVPSLLARTNPRDLVAEILEELAETSRTAELEDRRERILARMACKGAVKANADLSESEVKALCTDLDAAATATTCPHGRPLFILLSQGDLERMFHRK